MPSNLFTQVRVDSRGFDYAAAPQSNVPVIAGIVLGTLATAVVGSFGSLNAPDFYAALSKPAWAPPAWLFGPAWTLLYAMMALAAILVVRGRDMHLNKPLLVLYGAQLVANGLWSWLFFHWQIGGAAFADAGLMLLLVAATTLAFWQVRRVSGMLMLPYVAWVAFATALSYSVWQRNPSLL